MLRSADSVHRTWGFSTAGRVFFGWGATSELRSASREFGARTLICTDHNIVESGIAELVQAILEEGGSEVRSFTDGVPEVDLLTVTKAAAMARDYAPDVVVGLGGGSNLDLAKSVAILLKHPDPLSAYYGESNIPGPVTNIVAVPTTAGTGSEVSPVAVITDHERSMKVGIASRRIIPKWAIVDPSLTISCPARVTAHSGMDALTHAIEAFCAATPADRSPHAIFVGKNPVSDSLAANAIQLIARSLELAVSEPALRCTRENMSLGSLLAGMAFSCAGTAAVHALQYPVGETTNTPHGLGNAMLLPTVMKAISAARIPEMAFIARCFDTNLWRERDEDAAFRAPALVERLAHSLQIPHRLREIGLKRDSLPQLAERASAVKRLLDNSPVTFDQQGLLQLLEEAY
jgi:alcohol dehydrogenase